MFSVKFLESIKPKDTPRRVYEKGSRFGFGVQISAKGLKSFFYGYIIKVDGKKKQRFMKLGTFGENGITLKEAGDLWQKAYNIRQSGRDPRIVRDNEARKEKEEHEKARLLKKSLEQQGSYQELLNAYIESLEADGKRSASYVKKIFKANAYKAISKSFKAQDVTSELIDDTLAIIEKRKANVLVNRMRSYLSAAFAFGFKSDKKRSRSRKQVMFGIFNNPVRDVLKSDVKEKKGERYLVEDEIKELWFKLPATNMSVKTISILKLLIISGQRVEEVIRMNVNDIDYASLTWELDKTKAKRPHVVPLADMSLEIIENLDTDINGFLFSSEVDEEGNSVLMKSNTISQACGRFCNQKNFTKFTPRDLRRTWKTLAGKAGISKFDRDRYQNHAMNDVSSEHYDRYDYLAEKQQVAVVWSTYLKKILD